MATKLLDLCVDAGASGVVVILRPNEEVQSPSNPPYFFRVYLSQEDEGTASEGEAVTLDAKGRFRVIAWDEDPDPVPEIDFHAPTWISPTVLLTVEGEFSIGSAADDPWPNT